MVLWQFYFSSGDALNFWSIVQLILCSPWISARFWARCLTPTYFPNGNLACQFGCYLQKICVQGLVNPWGQFQEQSLSLIRFSCARDMLSFIRLNKLINSADSEHLHNLSNVNSHLNYPNFILNLQNPITS